MGVRRKFSSEGQSRHFAYRFHVTDEAVQMDVKKTSLPFLYHK